MLKNLIIPSNFDAAAILNLAEKRQCTPINIDRLNYIRHCISTHFFTYKPQQDKKDKYAPLCTHILRKIVPNYKYCLDLLVKANVIKTNCHYIPGEACRGYIFTEEYIGKQFISVPLQLKKLGHNLEKALEVRQKANPGIVKLANCYTHLNDWLRHPGFQVDLDSARKAIHNNFYFKLNQIFNMKGQKGAVYIADKKLHLKFNRDVQLHLIELINNKGFGTTIDQSGHRLHSPLTRLPRYLRPFLTFQGKRLASLDIKNSQPYFTLLVLTSRQFYSSLGTKKEKFCLKALDKELFELLKPYLPTIRAIILPQLPEKLDGIASPTLKNYIQDVIAGSLYDRFVSVPKDDPNYKLKREQLKERFMAAIYDVAYNHAAKSFINAYRDPFTVFNLIKRVETGRFKKRVINRRRRRERAKEIKELKKEQVLNLQKVAEGHNAPAVRQEYKLIDTGYAKLSTLLQRIESACVLDVVCKTISEANPSIPLFTIHDSIITTIEHVNSVKNVMLTEMNRIIGHPPKIELENW